MHLNLITNEMLNFKFVIRFDLFQIPNLVAAKFKFKIQHFICNQI